MKHIIVYSHGFGSDKTDRGLFTDISNAFPDIEHVMFRYNTFDQEHNITTVLPITKEAEMLNSVIENVKRDNHDAIIDLVCHSQGCTVAVIAKPVGVRNVIMLAPGASYSNEQMIDNFGRRPGSIVDVGGISIFARSDGGTAIIPAEYWKVRRGIEQIKCYNELSSITKLTIVNANQDEYFHGSDFSKMNPGINVINIDGRHNFSDAARAVVIDIIRKILV